MSAHCAQNKRKIFVCRYSAAFLSLIQIHVYCCLSLDVEAKMSIVWSEVKTHSANDGVKKVCARR